MTHLRSMSDGAWAGTQKRTRREMLFWKNCFAQAIAEKQAQPQPPTFDHFCLGWKGAPSLSAQTVHECGARQPTQSPSS